MPVPDFQAVMLPFLQLLSDGQEWKMRDVVESLAGHFSLTDEEREEMLPSFRQWSVGEQSVGGNECVCLSHPWTFPVLKMQSCGSHKSPRALDLAAANTHGSRLM